MSKLQLKETIVPTQDYICPLTGDILDPTRPDLIDTDRIAERAKDGGTYALPNVRIVTPRGHMERHGTLRERTDWLDVLKSSMDSRSQTMKLKMKINNQLLAYERLTDEPNPDDIAFLNDSLAPVQKRLDTIDRTITKHMKTATDPLVTAALGVPSCGPITVAGLVTYVDLEKANSASALWSYAGLHRASHERYSKGETSGGNKTLRTMLWNMANSMMKNRNCPYREVYDRTKTRLEASEKIVKSRTNQGKLVEVMWKDTMKSHRHHAAIRAIMKHFLADYWMVGRTLADLSTRPLYVQEQLGHTGIIAPADRGWIY